MKIPRPVQLPSGTWRIRMRLGGEEISLLGAEPKKLTKEAEYVKAEYRAGRRQAALKNENAISPTLSEAFDAYLTERSAVLSPATIRFYRGIQHDRFAALMDRRLDELLAESWQRIVNAEAALCATKTLKNAYAAVRTVVRAATGKDLPAVKLPAAMPSNRAWLTPDEIKVFVPVAAASPCAIPLLLALSSMRISEILALDWRDVSDRAEYVRLCGAVVLNENNQLTRKSQLKTAASARIVPVLIPELCEALECAREPSGPVVTVHPNTIRRECRRVCARAGVTDVTIHGLRHSFASLCYHLRVPEKIAQEIGGWSDSGTMHRIYTHVAQSDVDRYRGALAAFYARPAEGNRNSEG